MHAVIQPCLTLCHPMDHSPPGSSIHGFSRKNTGVGCHFFLQGIFWPRVTCLVYWQAGSVPLAPPIVRLVIHPESAIHICIILWWVSRLCCAEESTYMSCFPCGSRQRIVCRRPRFDPWVRNILWRRECSPLQYSCLETPHGQRSPAGYSPWDHKQPDTTEQLTLLLLLFAS